MSDEKKEFKKVSVPHDLKREIALLAASESRYEYQIVEDALKLYKAVSVGKSTSKKSKPVPVADVIATH